MKENKRQNNIFSFLSKVIDDEYYVVDDKINDKNKVFSLMCNKLIAAGLVKKDFMHDILTREEMDSTAFNNIAIPHSLSFNANQTVFSILISKKGIDWGGKMVNIVMLMAVNEDDKHMYFNVIDMFSSIFNSDKVYELINCTNSHEFIKKTLDYMALSH